MKKNKINTLRIIISVILLFSSFSVIAQNNQIEGAIYDIETRESVPFATVSVFDSEFNSLIDGTVSDENGVFIIDNIATGEFNVIISFIGYTPDTLSLISLPHNNMQLNLGDILLSPTVIELEGVEIVGVQSTAVRHIDRQTYRTGDFETARGGTAADLLSRLPSLSINPEGDISLRGTTDFVVYLNGKPTQMEPRSYLDKSLLTT